METLYGVQWRHEFVRQDAMMTSAVINIDLLNGIHSWPAAQARRVQKPLTRQLRDAACSKGTSF